MPSLDTNQIVCQQYRVKQCIGQYQQKNNHPLKNDRTKIYYFILYHYPNIHIIIIHIIHLIRIIKVRPFPKTKIVDVIDHLRPTQEVKYILEQMYYH